MLLFHSLVNPWFDQFNFVAAWTQLVLDDGVRVAVGGKVVLENWTWHGPTPNEERFTQAVDGEVEIVVVDNASSAPPPACMKRRRSAVPT